MEKDSDIVFTGTISGVSNVPVYASCVSLFISSSGISVKKWDST